MARLGLSHMIVMAIANGPRPLSEQSRVCDHLHTLPICSRTGQRSGFETSFGRHGVSLDQNNEWFSDKLSSLILMAPLVWPRD
jgi:hypothetical protein